MPSLTPRRCRASDACSRALLDVRQAFLDQRFRRLLQRRIDRRVHAQAALVDALPAEAFDQFPADLLLEIEAGRFLDLETVPSSTGVAAPVRTSAWSIAPVDTIAWSTTLRRAIARSRLTGGRIARWRLDQPGEERRLLDRQVARGPCRNIRATPPRRRTGRRRNRPCSGTARGSRLLGIHLSRCTRPE